MVLGKNVRLVDLVNVINDSVYEKVWELSSSTIFDKMWYLVRESVGRVVTCHRDIDGHMRFIVIDETW